MATHAGGVPCPRGPVAPPCFRPAPKPPRFSTCARNTPPRQALVGGGGGRRLHSRARQSPRDNGLTLRTMSRGQHSRSPTAPRQGRRNTTRRIYECPQRLRDKNAARREPLKSEGGSDVRRVKQAAGRPPRGQSQNSRLLCCCCARRWPQRALPFASFAHVGARTVRFCSLFGHTSCQILLFFHLPRECLGQTFAQGVVQLAKQVGLGDRRGGNIPEKCAQEPRNWPNNLVFSMWTP